MHPPHHTGDVTPGRPGEPSGHHGKGHHGASQSHNSYHHSPKPSKSWNPKPTTNPGADTMTHHGSDTMNHPVTKTHLTKPAPTGEPTTKTNHGTKTHKPSKVWPSASARARLSHDASDNMYALYGQAAAVVCGLPAQMPGAEITACPLENGTGWDCLNLASTLESCGGCQSLSQGQDCTAI